MRNCYLMGIEFQKQCEHVTQLNCTLKNSFNENFMLCAFYFNLNEKSSRKFLTRFTVRICKELESFTKYISNNQKHQLLITVNYLFQRSCKFIHLSTLRLKAV